MFVEHKEAMEVSEAPAKVLKLSAAIREGMKLRGECSKSWAADGRSCALVAACEATGMPYQEGMLFPPIFAHMRANFRSVPREVWAGIPNKMDIEDFTRERVADWLESQGY